MPSFSVRSEMAGVRIGYTALVGYDATSESGENRPRDTKSNRNSIRVFRVRNELCGQYCSGGAVCRGHDGRTVHGVLLNERHACLWPIINSGHLLRANAIARTDFATGRDQNPEAPIPVLENRTLPSLLEQRDGSIDDPAHGERLPSPLMEKLIPSSRRKFGSTPRGGWATRRSAGSRPPAPQCRCRDSASS